MSHMKRIGKTNRQYDYYDPRGSPHREVLRFRKEVKILKKCRKSLSIL